MNRLKPVIAGLLILTILGWMGCFDSDENPDVSNIKVDLNRVDFDDAFLAMEPGDNIKSEVEILKSQYPILTDIFINNIMQFRRPRDTSDQYLIDINGFLGSDLVHGPRSSTALGIGAAGLPPPPFRGESAPHRDRLPVLTR